MLENLLTCGWRAWHDVHTVEGLACSCDPHFGWRALQNWTLKCVDEQIKLLVPNGWHQVKIVPEKVNFLLNIKDRYLRPKPDVQINKNRKK